MDKKRHSSALSVTCVQFAFGNTSLGSSNRFVKIGFLQYIDTFGRMA